MGRVVRAVEVCAIARRKESARPNIEFGRQFYTSDSVQNADLVGAAIVLRVEHELDVGCRGPVYIQTDAVKNELVGCVRTFRRGMRETRLQSRANTNGAHFRLSP